MIEILDQYDKTIMLFLNYDGGVWVDNFWYTFSGKWVWIGVYFVILCQFFLSCRGISTKKRWKAMLWLIIATALLITLCDQTASGIIKRLVERPRPSHTPDIEGLLHYVNGYRGGNFGFVSSHAANSIGLALWLCLSFHKIIFSSVIVLWSLLTCYSRIYLGAHYLGDILGGLCVGILCAYIIYYLYKKFVPKDEQLPVAKKEPWAITCPIVVTCILIGAFAI